MRSYYEIDTGTQTKGSVLSFIPPGFRQSIDVTFPEARLPVCDRCKKHYKTRDMCRIRHGHTSLPWTTAYMCITVDKSCTDKDNKFVNGASFATRPSPPKPYCVKAGQFDLSTMPVCSECKQKNYTRSYCREKLKHLHLPWSTVYSLLTSTAYQAGKQTYVAQKSGGVAARTRPAESSSPSTNSDIDSEKRSGDSKDTPKSSTPEQLPKGTKRDAEEVAEEKEQSEQSAAKRQKKVEARESNQSDSSVSPAKETEKSDDINDISESRTFLVKISSRSCVMRWVDLDKNFAPDAANIREDSREAAYGRPGSDMDPRGGPYPQHARAASAYHGVPPVEIPQSPRYGYESHSYYYPSHQHHTHPGRVQHGSVQPFSYMPPDFSPSGQYSDPRIPVESPSRHTTAGQHYPVQHFGGDARHRPLPPQSQGWHEHQQHMHHNPHQGGFVQASPAEHFREPVHSHPEHKASKDHEDNHAAPGHAGGSMPSHDFPTPTHYSGPAKPSMSQDPMPHRSTSSQASNDYGHQQPYSEHTQHQMHWQAQHMWQEQQRHMHPSSHQGTVAGQGTGTPHEMAGHMGGGGESVHDTGQSEHHGWDPHPARDDPYWQRHPQEGKHHDDEDRRGPFDEYNDPRFSSV